MDVQKYNREVQAVNPPCPENGTSFRIETVGPKNPAVSLFLGGGVSCRGVFSHQKMPREAFWQGSTTPPAAVWLNWVVNPTSETRWTRQPHGSTKGGSPEGVLPGSELVVDLASPQASRSYCHTSSKNRQVTCLQQHT